MDSPEAIAALLQKMEYRKRRYFIRHKVGWVSRFLYKFRSLDPGNSDSVAQMRDLIVRSRLWLASALDFNDPFDMSAHTIIDGTAKERRNRLDQILKMQGMPWHDRQKILVTALSKPEIEIQAVARNSMRAIMDRFGVCSFGGDPRNIQMWSHYSSNHKGFCLQLETARDPFTFCNCIKIEYLDDYPIIKWTTSPDEGIHGLITRKHPGWGYEQETRLIIQDKSRQHLQFEPGALKSIIVGCATDEAGIDVLRKLLKERASSGIPLPKIYRAVRHPTKYKLVITRESIAL